MVLLVWRLKTDDATRARFDIYNRGAAYRALRWTSIALTAFAILEIGHSVLVRFAGLGLDAPIWTIPLNAVAAGVGFFLSREIRSLHGPRKRP